MTGKHTPGPWKWRTSKDDRTTSLVGDPRQTERLGESALVLVTSVCPECLSRRPGPEDKALIAASPDLLEALQFILDNTLPGSVNSVGKADVERARKAIMKAGVRS